MKRVRIFTAMSRKPRSHLVHTRLKSETSLTNTFLISSASLEKISVLNPSSQRPSYDW